MLPANTDRAFLGDAEIYKAYLGSNLIWESSQPMPEPETGVLPDGYTQVQYIQSTGTQYI